MAEFLVTIHTDEKLLKFLLTPKITIDSYGYSIIPVEPSCDHCGTRLAINRNSSNPTGYALFDRERLWEVMCENCKNRFWSGLKTYETLAEALRRET